MASYNPNPRFFPWLIQIIDRTRNGDVIIAQDLVASGIEDIDPDLDQRPRQQTYVGRLKIFLPTYPDGIKKGHIITTNEPNRPEEFMIDVVRPRQGRYYRIDLVSTATGFIGK